MVMRKLEQHVDLFEKFVEKNAKGKLDKEKVKACILGRTVAGNPLIPVQIGNTSNELASGKPEKPNNFDYKKDPVGVTCPLHAHIRRANPRSSPKELTPRILRRGFSYIDRPDESADKTKEAFDEAAEEKRGLLFMAYNASIARQYEVIQRWLNGGNSTGLSSIENDLFTAPSRGGVHRVVVEGGANGGPNSFLFEGKKLESVALAETDVKRPFVTLQWGLYLFVPSVGAIDWLIRELPPRPVSTTTRAVSRGTTTPPPPPKLDEVLEKLKLSATTPKTRWKEVLEEHPREAALLWAAIRATNKTLKTPYGFLVATVDGAKTVLSDESRFSVREYWQRLRETIGEHYLAMDDRPTPMSKRKVSSGVDDALYERRVPRVSTRSFPLHRTTTSGNRYRRTRPLLPAQSRAQAGRSTRHASLREGQSTRSSSLKLPLAPSAFSLILSAWSRWPSVGSPKSGSVCRYSRIAPVSTWRSSCGASFMSRIAAFSPIRMQSSAKRRSRRGASSLSRTRRGENRFKPTWRPACVRRMRNPVKPARSWFSWR